MIGQTEIDARQRELRTWYDGYVFKCRMFQQELTKHLDIAIRNAGLEDAKLETRAKTVKSFVEKAVQLTPAGDFKYVDPMTEITDLVGARILVPLSTDLPEVAQLVRRTYEVDEETERGDEESHVDVPGYRSLHFLVRLKEEQLRDVDLREFEGMTAEVQVRTTLQHAWASLEHDIMYKTERAPSPAVRRRLIALAGLLELADREFIQVRHAHSEVRETVREATFDSEQRLSAAALRHLTESILGEEDAATQDWFVQLREVLNDLGVTTAEELGAALSTWRQRGAEVAATVRASKPWANSAFIVDVMLRLALKERYIELRPMDSDGDRMTEEERALATEEYLSELRDLERMLTAS